MIIFKINLSVYMQPFSAMNYRINKRLRWPGFSGRLAIPLCGLWLLVASGLSPAAEVNNPIMFTEEGQGAFDKGKFSEAAEQWQRALNHYREQGNGRVKIRTSISLAAACQAIGQHRRAVQTLESALACAKSSGAPSQLPLLKSRLGAALTMTRERERAAELLNSALEAARTARDLKLEGEILNDLGNLSCSQRWFMEALTYYDASAEGGPPRPATRFWRRRRAATPQRPRRNPGNLRERTN